MPERELLKSALKAWDSLKEGNHRPSEVNRWLADTMAPAMQDIRNFFADEEISHRAFNRAIDQLGKPRRKEAK